MTRLPTGFHALVTALAPMAAVFPAAAFAQADPIAWNVDAVRSNGVGCRFVDGPDAPADAFLIANGTQVTAIFTRLGAAFRDDPRTGESRSECAYRFPGRLEPGYFVSTLEQTITYGLVKTAGVGVRLAATTNFARRLPNGRSRPNDLMKNLAAASTSFAVGKVINQPLGVLTAQPVRVKKGAAGDNGWSRFCERGRLGDFDALQSLLIGVDRRSPDAQATISIDGLDVRYVVNAGVEPCR